MGVYVTPELVSELASVRAASVWLDGVFAAERLEGETCDVCLLLLDELVANAVKHGRGGVGVRVDVRDPIRVEVTNRGTEGTVAPIPYERGRPAEHFGLHVVHGLASSWGVSRDTGDTVVWFEVPHPGPTATSDVDLTVIERDEVARQRESLRASPVRRAGRLRPNVTKHSGSPGRVEGVMASTGEPTEVPRELPSSFEDFFRAEYTRVVGLAAVLCGRSAVAEELAQDAFVSAYRRWDRIAGYDDPGAWVRRVTVNLATSSLRRGAREARALARLARRPPEASSLPVDDEFWRCVRRLPRRQAQCIALHYLEDRSPDDIAGILDIAPSTVRVHLHAARAALAARLGEQLEGRETP